MEYAAIIEKLGEKILPEKKIDSVADEDEETKWRRYELCRLVTFLLFLCEIFSLAFFNFFFLFQFTNPPWRCISWSC